MTIKQLRKALMGKYIHFTAKYRSEDTVWGGDIREVRKEGLYLIPYFDGRYIVKNAFVAFPEDKLEELATEGQAREDGIIYTQLLDSAPKIGNKALVVFRIPMLYGFEEEVMFYTIGNNEYLNTRNCSKCSLQGQKCNWACTKYRCSYLEKFELK